MSKISDNLYISGIDELVRMSPKLASHGIDHIVCCLHPDWVLGEYQKIIEQNPKCRILFLPMYDSISQSLSEINNGSIFLVGRQNHDQYHGLPYTEVAYNFIDKAHIADSRVLIHCMAGISRSVSICCYYMMKQYGMTYDRAIEIIKNSRSIANPNESFRSQLLKYSNSLGSGRF